MMEQLKESLKTLVRNFQEAEFEKKVKYIFITIWLLFFSCYIFLSEFITAMIQFFMHVWVITAISLLIFIVYAVICAYTSKTEGAEDDSLREVFEPAKSVSNRVRSFRECNLHKFSEHDESLLTDEREYDINPSYRVRICSNWRNDSLREQTSLQGPYYLLETSTFFAMQEYTRRRGYSVSDIIYGEMTLDDCFEELAEAIKKHLCYVSYDIYNEVRRLEDKGAFEAGTSIFIQEDMSIWPKVSRELSYEEFCFIFGKTKERYYNIIMTADEISKKRDSEVWIVTTSKKLIALVNAYADAYDARISVVNPSELEE